MKKLNTIIELFMYIMPALLLFGGITLFIYSITYFVLHINILVESSSIFINDNAINTKLFGISIISCIIGLMWRHVTMLWYEDV